MSALSSRKGLLAPPRPPRRRPRRPLLAARRGGGARVPAGRRDPPRPPGRAARPPAASEIPPLAFHQERGEIGGAVVRNVFSFHVPPTPTPEAASRRRRRRSRPPARPSSSARASRRRRRPRRRSSRPAIPFRAIGVFGPREKPIVTFEDGPRLINAREGDVLDGRFILKRVGRESVDFAFVGLPPEITRRIPVLPPDALR